MSLPLLLRCLLFLLLSVLAPVTCADHQLNIVSHPMAPLIWEENGKPQGAFYELVTAIQQRLGTHYPTLFVPFKRGLAMVQNRSGYLFYPCLRTPEREKQLQWVGPLLKSQGILYRLAHQPPIHTQHEIAGLKQIGVLLGSSSDEYLSALGGNNVRRYHTREEMVRLLDMGRLDAIIMVDTAMASLITQLQLDPARIVASPVFLFRGDYYLAFSPNTPSRQLEQWQQALQQVQREQGAAIYRRYHIPIPVQPDPVSGASATNTQQD